MRWTFATIVGLGMLAGATNTPALAAAAPGAAANAIQSASQVEKVHRRGHHHGFGGFGIYVGPRWGGYYPYYGSSYYDDDYYDYPRYRYRRYYGGHRHYRHRHYRRHRHHWH